MLNIILRVSAFLARINGFIYILIGTALMPFLNLLIQSRGEGMTVQLMHNRLFWLSTLVIFVASWPACVIFYGDQYDNYLKDTRTRLTWPEPDRYFYKTQISDISALRKVAGYVYVFCKAGFLLALGVVFFYGLRSEITGQVL